MIVAESDHRKKIGDYFPLLLLDLDEKNDGVASVRLNPKIEKDWFREKTPV
jgi:hypothetical protein